MAVNSRWLKISDNYPTGPKIYGYFVDNILRGTYHIFNEVWMANLLCFQSTNMHTSVTTATYAAAKNFVEENYIKNEQHEMEFCRHKD